MTPERMRERQEQLLAMSREITEWGVLKARARSKNDMAALQLLFKTRKLAETLFDDLVQETDEGLMLRHAYLQAVNGTLPVRH